MLRYNRSKKPYAVFKSPLEPVLKYVIGIYYRPFLMQNKANFYSIAELRLKILTGPKEKANDLAFERGASWRVGRKKGHKKTIDILKQDLVCIK
ncbi:MAG: hypothetical protein WBG90_02405 [Saonia sp.]